MKKPYVSRRKERVCFVGHGTKLDGTVEHAEPPFPSYLQWVYKRADGSEYIGLKAQQAVRRVDGVAHVDTYSKEVACVPLAEVLARAAGSSPVSLGGGLVAFVKKEGPR